MTPESLAALSLGLSIATLVMLAVNWLAWTAGNKRRPKDEDDVHLLILTPGDEEDPADFWKRGRKDD